MKIVSSHYSMINSVDASRVSMSSDTSEKLDEKLEVLSLAVPLRAIKNVFSRTPKYR